MSRETLNATHNKSRDVLWYAAAVAIAAGVFAALWALAPPAVVPKPLEHAYYVWQKQWNGDVRESVSRADADAHAFMVLAGEINAAANGALRLDPAYPGWNALAAYRTPLTLVVRANAALGDALEFDAQSGAAAFVCDTFARVLEEAEAKGVSIAGLQLDYDCPSSKLESYAALVDAWRARFGAYELSITALPTWLKWAAFSELAGKLSYYVLQVHSLDAPASIDDDVILCDTTLIPGYLRRAAALNVPFYIALPTYGYRFVFDGDGKFTAIFAEGPQPELQPGYTIRTVMTDAASVAEVVRALQRMHPPTLRGIAWFRLPVATDTLNWTWPALVAVREGRTPVTAINAELRAPSPGLFEVWVVNTGETSPTGAVRVPVRYSANDILAFDVHGGFSPEPESGGHVLAGPAPRPETSALAAWYRTRTPQTAGPTVGTVTMVPQ
ncbi:MAG: DUF3142 domain-containing protein [Candidatus Hydrogenedentes bacterium]|nr:DUF3142 domain-containing protein [Candidatus Hydrogenedentota bacterium]